MSATKLLAAAAALASFGLAAAPALSAPDPDQITVRVKVGDLNLDTDTGARVALSRIRNASFVICGERPALQEIKAGMLHRECMSRTVGQAVAMANKPVLTALAGGTGQTAVLAAR